MSEIFREVKEKLTMLQVAMHFGYRPNRSGFILSPFNEEKTPSCKIYDKSFYDFSAVIGGDLIYFTAAILHSNNFEACQYLVQAFSLSVSLSGTKDGRGKVEQKQRLHQYQQERQKELKTALRGEIDTLKHWENIYRMAVEKSLFEPFTDDWCYCVDELQKIECQLDVLCAVDCMKYPRLKSYHENLSTDRYQWLSDVLEILQERKVFTATEIEKSKIRRAMQTE